ncbi:MAG: hypothetical protein N3A54_05280 [Patescibacteria group bacterium]|nr:hypothetical protein [Patescibacteria group bacterium]
MADFLTRETPKATSIVSTLAILAFLPLFMLGLYQIYTILRASGTAANIVVDTNVVLEPVDTNFLRAFAQGGEEATDMIAPIVQEVRALRPRIIRIDHIYDYYNVVGRNGSELTFDWSRLDQAVNSILATGAKPMLALSYMPSVIAKDGNIINPPNDWNEWATVVQRTIEYYSGRSNRNISGMYYEVWNEPDLAQFGGWKLSGEKNYLILYRYAAIGAQNAKNVQPFSLGGPSTTGLYRNWIVSLASSGNRVDFFSWHSYIMDPKQFERDQKNLTEWLLPFPRYVLLPKFVTEFGFTGAKDSRYNTMFAAAHMAAVTRQIISGGPTYLFTFQLKDGPNQENGWGILTHETQGKKPKPRYFVPNFLQIMDGNRLFVTGEGTWTSAFATIRDNTIRLLLVNFNHQNSRSETVPITFVNLEPGTYSYRERFLLGRDITLTETITDTQLKKQIFLPVNSVAIIELKKQ